MKTPSGADDNGLRAAEQEFQTVLLDGRLKAADDNDAGVPHCADEVISLHDGFSVAFERAE